MNPKASPPTEREVICFVTRWERPRQISIASSQERFPLSFILTWSQGSKTHYPPLCFQRSKPSWLSHSKYTSKVEPLLPPPAPPQRCCCTLQSRRRVEQPGRWAAGQTISKNTFPCNATCRKSALLHTSHFLLFYSFFSFLFSFFTSLTPRVTSIVPCVVVTHAGTSDTFKSFWKGCQSLLEKSLGANTHFRSPKCDKNSFKN